VTDNIFNPILEKFASGKMSNMWSLHASCYISLF
jgi:hypothetical protein